MNSATTQQQGSHQNIPDGADQVFLEQVRLIYSGATYATVVTLTVGTILVYAQREMASPVAIAGWSCCMIAGTLARIYLVWRFGRTESQREKSIVYWRDLYVALVLFLSAGWGAAGYCSFPLTRRLTSF